MNTTYLTPVDEPQEDLPPVLSLATFRRSGCRAWEVRPGFTVFCSAVSGTQKPRWWVSILEAPTNCQDFDTGFGCTPELDSDEVPEILRAIQLRSRV